MPETPNEQEHPARTPLAQRQHDLKMLAWLLTYRVSMTAMLTVGHLRWAGRWCLTPSEVEQMPTTEPDWFLEIVRARQRRRDYAAKNGHCPGCWTPPPGWQDLPECAPPPLRAPLEPLTHSEYYFSRDADQRPGETRDLATIRLHLREEKTRISEAAQEWAGVTPGTQETYTKRSKRKPSGRR